jgi:hypothetical protein
MITFAVTPPTNLSNTPGTGTSSNTHADGLSISYFDANNCARMIEIQDSIGGTMPGNVSVDQTVYPTIASFSSGTFVGRKTEVNAQDPKAKAQLKLYFTFQDIENYNQFNGGGVDLVNDTVGGTMQIGVLQLHTDSTGHIEQIKHNPITANWKTAYASWEVNFPIQKFSTFYAGENQSISDFTCENSGLDSIVTSSSYYIWHGDSVFASGVYMDTLVNVNGCDSVTTLEITFFATGVMDAGMDQALQIYPNPNKGMFTLSVNEISEHTVMTIYNSLGHEVYRQQITNKTETVNTELARGVYILKLQNTHGVAIRRVVIQN